MSVPCVRACALRGSRSGSQPSSGFIFDFCACIHDTGPLYCTQYRVHAVYSTRIRKKSRTQHGNVVPRLMKRNSNCLVSMDESNTTGGRMGSRRTLGFLAHCLRCLGSEGGTPDSSRKRGRKRSHRATRRKCG